MVARAVQDRPRLLRGRHRPALTLPAPTHSPVVAEAARTLAPGVQAAPVAVALAVAPSLAPTAQPIRAVAVVALVALAQTSAATVDRD